MIFLKYCYKNQVKQNSSKIQQVNIKDKLTM